MYMKICAQCGNKMYSASEEGNWQCDDCGRNLNNTVLRDIKGNKIKEVNDNGNKS